ncbi:hypothetical protein PMIN04_009462 [Paraphaeosphaeria minitans]
MSKASFAGMASWTFPLFPFCASGAACIQRRPPMHQGDQRPALSPRNVFICRAFFDATSRRSASRRKRGEAVDGPSIEVITSIAPQQQASRILPSHLLHLHGHGHGHGHDIPHTTYHIPTCAPTPAGRSLLSGAPTWPPNALLARRTCSTRKVPLHSPPPPAAKYDSPHRPAPEREHRLPKGRQQYARAEAP